MPHHVVIVAFEDAELLDITGPASVFANAGAAEYALTLAAAKPGPLRTSSGLQLIAACDLAHAPRRIDTLLVAGGEGTRAACADPRFIASVLRLATRAGRVASVCSGSFILAHCGMLDGRRATTHWRHAALLQRSFPRVQVEPDAIFVKDGKCWTSAGVSAGMDLALAMVEADLGRSRALDVARQLVLFLKRPGGQSQFSVPLASQASEQPLLARIRQQVIERPQAAWSVASLAERANVSERHLRRLFQRELAIGPREFVTRTRLEHAQRILSDSAASIGSVARRCGYGTAQSFSKRFEARFGVAPATWRARFRP